VRRCYLAVDGSGWDEELAHALLPFLPAVLAADRWPALADGSGAEGRLDWLARRFVERPLLGLTWAPFSDGRGSPLRGVARLAERVALVSRAGVMLPDLQGVVRHELAHSLGLDHCARWSCALNERPWPLALGGRHPDLCGDCEDRLHRRALAHP
jgi:hypothetical protein